MALSWTTKRGILLLCSMIGFSVFYIIAYEGKFSLPKIVNENGLSFPTNGILQNYVNHSERKFSINKTLNNSILNDVLQDLADVARVLQYAENHARGIKTAQGISKAKMKLKNLLNRFGQNFDEVTKRPLQESKHFCSDKYMGGTYGNPYYEKGFETINCTKKADIKSLLTVLIIDKATSNNLTDLINSLSSISPDIQVIISVSLKTRARYNAQFKDKKTVKLITHEDGDSEGKIWNALVEKVNTKFTLIARNVTLFDKNVHIERLLREIDTLNMTGAAGAIRDQHGQWRIGCYQRAFRNFTLVYYEGYDESAKECVICDHVDGPFVIRTQVAIKLKFDEKVRAGVFEDYFMQVGYDHAIVCPDSMFQVDFRPRSKYYNDWEIFANKLFLYKLKFVPGFEIVFPCKKPYTCFKSKYYAIHPCCLMDLATLVIDTMGICTHSHSVCELDTGTLIGAAKMGKVLPWEVDGDIMFLASNFSAMNAVGKTLHKQGVHFSIGYPVIKDKNNRIIKAGYFSLKNNYWTVEMWGMRSVTSEKWLKLGKNQTKVLMNGQWLATSYNPGQTVRNRYGIEVYRHSIHWRTLGFKSSYVNYSTNHFVPCNTPGDHKCLSQYRTDGNLQFADPIP